MLLDIFYNKITAEIAKSITRIFFSPLSPKCGKPITQAAVAGSKQQKIA